MTARQSVEGLSTEPTVIALGSDEVSADFETLAESSAVPDILDARSALDNCVE